LLLFSACFLHRSYVKCAIVLSGIYIKGFKTFARPVRMPLEGGVTAIVGPNGSGKSNITDAVLFALGEQSPGVLRAGAMSELIFSGSETLPPAGAAEVTLVLDNGAGEISLPYEEVSITRRISRAGETEYRINGSRARLQDVRAVAGEAGIGRHSILRQGAVDAIVAGGAAACRLALEEAAGLGVYRRRRLSASRRLEKAASQLEKTRELEAELSSQLRRLEREAVAAREYRELEARYRELSLAHLYRAATRDLEGLQRRLEESEALAADLASRQEALGEEEELLARRTAALEGRLRETEAALEALEDGAEDLRGESLRADRNLFRLEAGRGGDLRRSAARLEEGLERISRTLTELEERRVAADSEHAAVVEESSRLRTVLEEARRRAASAGKERSRLAAEVETLRARLEQTAPSLQQEPLAREDLGRLAQLAESLERISGEEVALRLAELRGRLGDGLALIEGRAEEADRRRGTLSAAVGRGEAKVRALQEAAPGGDGTRLYEVIRARPGYEAAVEAALGEFGAGVLAQNVDEGLRLLSGNERVAVRLDAGRIEEGGAPPGKPLVECVEVLDRRYAQAVERLLGGIYVIDEPQKGAPSNGYVAVTRQGLRLTRTSLSRKPASGGFAREAMLDAALERLEALKKGPGERLYDLRERISAASGRIERLATTAQDLSTLADRASRARARLARDAARRLAAAAGLGRDLAERRRLREALILETHEKEEALIEAQRLSDTADGDASSAAQAVAEADEASEVSRRRQRALGSALAEGRDRHTRHSRRLQHARDASGRDALVVARATGRAAARASSRVAAAVRERRNALRAARAQTADAHRASSTQRTDLAREAASLAGHLAAARAAAERLREDLERARASAAEATEEIEAEWGATLEAARSEAGRHPPETAEERARLARRLKRFGDVNLLALSQEEELRERHEFVSAQRADAEAAANELNRIILSIDREIEARFGETFERVRGAFGEIVPRMMVGASGVLDLSEEGVEVGLRLGRRGWKPLRVLSGGERALLALSFLFSIFLSRPGGDAGAFCVLDEAEAALDDLNLARFLAVVDSHRATGQYLLVTHQKRTMAAADVLYGVVQDAAGATTVVSKRMQGE
jgi:chromosome segregation protein